MNSTVLLLTLFVCARLMPVAIMLPPAFTAARSWRWSLALLVLFSLIIVPLQVHAPPKWNVINLEIGQSSLILAGLLRELLLGLSLGFGFSLLLSGLQLTAMALEQMTGLTWMLSSSRDGTPGGLQRYFGLLALSFFIVSGGHRHLVGVLLDSFGWLPAGQGLPKSELGAPVLLANFLTESFRLGIRAAAPVAFCLMVTSLLVAVIGRNGSALGGFSVNIALNLVVLLLVSWASLGATATVFQETWSGGMAQLVQLLKGAS